MQKTVLLALTAALLVLGSVHLFKSEGNLQESFLPSNTDSSLLQEYTIWKSKYNQNFNGSEDSYRFQVFRKSKAIVEENNKENNGLTLELNKFAAMTNEEFQQKMLIERPTKQEEQIVEPEVTNTSLPASIDWRKKGAVTSVKNQGNCGSCWAFSVTAGLEGLYQIESGNLVNLSEQQLVSCDKVDAGCNGGLEINGYKYAAANGIETDEDYPYVSAGGKVPACEYNKSKVVFQNKGGASIPQQRPEVMKEQLTKQPISVAVNASGFAFQFYKSGVVLSSKCRSTQLNHAIFAVGYNTEAETPYFIVKNSWGADWGENGYILLEISNGIGACGVNMDPSYPTM